MPSPNVPVTDPDCPGPARTPRSRIRCSRRMLFLLGCLNPRARELLGLQFDGVYQYMPGFHSPYQGRNSLSFTK